MAPTVVATASRYRSRHGPRRSLAAQSDHADAEAAGRIMPAPSTRKRQSTVTVVHDGASVESHSKA